MTAGRTPIDDLGESTETRGKPMVAGIVWGTFIVMMLSVLWGIARTAALYERVGHGGLALDVDYGDDLDRVVRESW